LRRRGRDSLRKRVEKERKRDRFMRRGREMAQRGEEE
jgi:hypothetical protein